MIKKIGIKEAKKRGCKKGGKKITYSTKKKM